MEKIDFNFSWIDSASVATREVVVKDDEGNTMCFDEKDLLVLLSKLTERIYDV